ncbi:MAG: hypothetical protein WKG07_33270 [Hymenobacter sp.]
MPTPSATSRSYQRTGTIRGRCSHQRRAARGRWSAWACRQLGKGAPLRPIDGSFTIRGVEPGALGAASVLRGPCSRGGKP